MTKNTAFELQDKIEIMGMDCEKARLVLWNVMEDYFSSRKPDVEKLAFEYSRCALFLNVLDDYLLKIMEAVNTVVGDEG